MIKVFRSQHVHLTVKDNSQVSYLCYTNDYLQVQLTVNSNSCYPFMSNNTTGFFFWHRKGGRALHDSLKNRRKIEISLNSLDLLPQAPSKNNVGTYFKSPS